MLYGEIFFMLMEVGYMHFSALCNYARIVVYDDDAGELKKR